MGSEIRDTALSSDGVLFIATREGLLSIPEIEIPQQFQNISINQIYNSNNIYYFATSGMVCLFGFEKGGRLLS
jgi:hypothetical protein